MQLYGLVKEKQTVLQFISMLSHSTFSFYNKMMLAKVKNWNAKVSDRETIGDQDDDITLKVIVKTINSWESKKNSGL